MKFLITLSGLAGSGKSTISKMLVSRLHLSYINMGQIMRDQAKELGFPDIQSFDIHAMNHPELDIELDKKAIAFAQKHEHALLEGRLTGWMCHKYQIPSFKLFLTASLECRAQRLAVRDQKSVQEATQMIQQRDAAVTDRYKKVYNIDINDTSIYNLVIQTDSLTPEEIFTIISERLHKEGLI